MLTPWMKFRYSPLAALTEGAHGHVHDWYNNSRVHQGIHGIPDPDPELAGEKPAHGKLVARPVLNGLHHDYRLQAA